MRAKKRPTPKSKMVIRKYSAQCLTIRYGLRQAVCQAELLAKVTNTKSHISKPVRPLT
jgi:hypothetical protein